MIQPQRRSRRPARHATRSATAVAAVAAVIIAAAPSPAVADGAAHLAAARSALADLDYDGALRALDNARIAGGNAPAATAEIYRLLGQVHAALGQPADAERYYRVSLALDPDYRLPEGTSPKLAEPFADARASLPEGAVLAVECAFAREAVEPGEPGPALVLRVTADPAEVVAGARALYRIGDRAHSAEARGSSPIAVAIPDRPGLSAVCAAIDEHGNHLREIGSRDAPLVLAAAPAAAIDAPPALARKRTPIYVRWYLWAGLSAASAGAGVYFGFAARSDQDALAALNRDSSEHEFSEAEALERRGERNALLSNIAFGVAGATAVVAAITVIGALRAPSVRSGETKAARVVPVPVPSGAGFAVTTSF